MHSFGYSRHLHTFIARRKRGLGSVVLAVTVVISLFQVGAHAKRVDFQEEHVRFSNGDTVFYGTLLLPDVAGPHPAIVLIHGAGPLKRDAYRAEAEWFAASGVAALIYDKRTEGYSADGVGEHSRSYMLLAEDALAAVRALATRSDIDSFRIGLWGDSEGASVAPLAASQSGDVHFLVVVALSTVPPIQQTAWALANEFRHQGVTARSMIDAFTIRWMRFIAKAGLFAEAFYDPLPSLEKVSQPLLAIWGSNDRTAPPSEGALHLEEALKRGANPALKTVFIPEANHMLRLSADGFVASEEFAPGYLEAMRDWVAQVVQGEQPRGMDGHSPPQEYVSPPAVASPSWYDTGWLQLGLVVLLAFLFASHFWLRLFRPRNAWLAASALPGYARFLAVSGVIGTLGPFGYFGYVTFTQDIQPVVMGRPLPWLLLQLIAAFVSVLTLLVARAYWMARPAATRFERIRLGLLLTGGVLFIPWAYYWGLLAL